MQRALELATFGKGNVSPNPLVGCVIVHKNKIIGEGYHKKYGENHVKVILPPRFIIISESEFGPKVIGITLIGFKGNVYILLHLPTNISNKLLLKLFNQLFNHDVRDYFTLNQ